MTTETAAVLNLVGPPLRRFGPPLLLAASVALAGCGGSRTTGSEGAANRAPGASRDRGEVVSITIDGSAADWPEQRYPAADREYLFLPLASDGAAPLQGAPETMQLLLDVDANAITGSTEPLPIHPSLQDLGIDLVVEFSPRGDEGIERGVTAYALDSAGERTFVGHAGIGLVALPTHASEFYELRVRRDLASIDGLPTPGLQSSGSLSGLWVLRSESGDVEGWSDPFTVDLPAASGGPTLTSEDVPAKAETDFRIVSYNVERSAPLSNPGPFSRILKALDPDVILFQEWDEGTSEDLEAWLNGQLGGQWHTIKGGAQGVAIASIHPLTPAGPGELSLSAAGMSYPVRFVAGIVETSAGAMGIASVHLKCCGTSDSPEDLRRIAEAESINEELESAFAEVPIRVVAGDLNLVGSGDAMTPLRVGLDVDRTDLVVAPALVLGDSVATTWSNPRGRFAPGRLDYALIGDAAAETTRAFILDTRLLSSTVLGRAGLEGTDSDASDHLPLIVDIRPR